MRNIGLKQLTADLNKIAPKKRRTRFGLKKTIIRSHLRSMPQKHHVKRIVKKSMKEPEKKKFNWKKVAMYTLGGLGTAGVIYGASKYSQKGNDLRNKAQGVISTNINHTSENKIHKDRKQQREQANAPYKDEREAIEKLQKFNGKQNLTVKEKEEKERLVKLVHKLKAARIKEENIYEEQPQLFDFGVKKKNYRKTIVRTHLRNISPNHVKKIVKTPEKKKFNWKKAAMYTLGGIGTAGSIFALSRYNKNKNSPPTTTKDKNSFKLPFTPMPQTEKQYILEMNELEYKENEIQKELSEETDENKRKELQRLLKTIKNTISEKKMERNKKTQFGNKRINIYRQIDSLPPQKKAGFKRFLLRSLKSMGYEIYGGIKFTLKEVVSTAIRYVGPFVLAGLLVKYRKQVGAYVKPHPFV